MSVIDLDILFEKEKEESVKFNLDEQELVLKLHVSPRVAMLSIKLVQDGKDQIESTAELVSAMIKEQFNKDIKPGVILDKVKFEILLYLDRKLTNLVLDANDIIKSEGGGSATKKK